MIIRKLHLLFFLLLFLTLQSQTSKVLVEYNFTNNNNYTEIKSLLVFDRTTSIYKAFSGRSLGSETEKKGNTIFIGGDPVDVYQVSNLKTNELLTYDSLEGDETLKISEKIPDFNWDLNYNDSKKIGNYTCHKATASFRGRDYIAWYSEEIPCKFGPWKFNGLPGLIIEISDKTQTYSWKVKKIVSPANEDIILPFKNATNISLSEYVDLAKKRMEVLRTRVRTVMPRGTEFKVPKNSRRGIEVVFEWEK